MWVRSGDYDRIISGEYRKRGTKADAREEAGDATDYYADKFRAIFKEAGVGVKDRRQGQRRGRQAVGLLQPLGATSAITPGGAGGLGSRSLAPSWGRGAGPVLPPRRARALRGAGRALGVRHRGRRRRPAGLRGRGRPRGRGHRAGQQRRDHRPGRPAWRPTSGTTGRGRSRPTCSATVLMCRAVLPGMRERGYGKIINLSGGGGTGAAAELQRLRGVQGGRGALHRDARGRGRRHRRQRDRAGRAADAHARRGARGPALEEYAHARPRRDLRARDAARRLPRRRPATASAGA